MNTVFNISMTQDFVTISTQTCTDTVYVKCKQTKYISGLSNYCTGLNQSSWF